MAKVSGVWRRGAASLLGALNAGEAATGFIRQAADHLRSEVALPGTSPHRVVELASKAADLLIVATETSPDDAALFLRKVLPSREQWRKLEQQGLVDQWEAVVALTGQLALTMAPPSTVGAPPCSQAHAVATAFSANLLMMAAQRVSARKTGEWRPLVAHHRENRRREKNTVHK
ncbi:PREDICTED: uncharacterized protein LOC106817414 [Priapulus caudatus]|uniref:Uncharacterized protein LOC106817414 n=1 Tax=Priapulus caudatus TaxID=37621 RepID=A0ABM1EZE4_PRICU|nr:PREDICTED: uncharacterized protein LOC106817414 [Priapulus caudatus]